MSKFLKCLLVCTAVTLSAAPLAPAPVGAEAAGSGLAIWSKPCITPSMLQLKNGLRKLWTDHAIWTRAYIVSAVAGLEEQKEVLARLLRNQQDLGNAIKPYYGEAAGNKLAELLKEHILIAGQIIEAVKAGNQADMEKYNKEWYRNADDIAKFLSSANPNWPYKEVQQMMHVHLQLLTDMLAARLKKDWNAEIIAFDKGLDHLLMLADTLSDGIIKQFPKQFK